MCMKHGNNKLVARANKNKSKDTFATTTPCFFKLSKE